MASAIPGIIIPVNGLSILKMISKLSYIRNPKNNENACIAYFSFLRPVFRYEETDSPISTAANSVAIIYRKASRISVI
jgi:hypothetical protein